MKSSLYNVVMRLLLGASSIALILILILFLSIYTYGGQAALMSIKESFGDDLFLRIMAAASVLTIIGGIMRLVQFIYED